MSVSSMTNRHVGQSSSIESISDHEPPLNYGDVRWSLSLFGTAVGAGVLFLPINAGIGGIIPLIIMAVLAFPISFYAHRGLTRLALSGSENAETITDTVDEHFGQKAATAFTVIYFLSIYPILLVYAVTITNTVNAFMIHQLHTTPPPRGLLSLLLIAGLIAIVRLGREAVVKVMSILVYPFIATLVGLSIYLIPHWNTSFFQTFNPSFVEQNTGESFGIVLFLMIPVMVFSFNHSPIISSFAAENRAKYGPWAEHKTGKILAAAEILMVIVVMFFVFSCAFALSPQQMVEAKEQNVTVLTYMSTAMDNPGIAWVAAILAMVAVVKSFLGHYLGAAEGFGGLIHEEAEAHHHVVSNRMINLATLAFMLVSAWLVAWADPSVLGMIETLCGPTIAIVLFLVPQYAMYKVPSLRKYAGHLPNYFIIVIGLLAVITIGYNIFQLF